MTTAAPTDDGAYGDADQHHRVARDNLKEYPLA